MNTPWKINVNTTSKANHAKHLSTPHCISFMNITENPPGDEPRNLNNEDFFVLRCFNENEVSFVVIACFIESGIKKFARMIMDFFNNAIDWNTIHMNIKYIEKDTNACVNFLFPFKLIGGD